MPLRRGCGCSALTALTKSKRADEFKSDCVSRGSGWTIAQFDSLSGSVAIHD